MHTLHTALRSDAGPKGVSADRPVLSRPPVGDSVTARETVLQLWRTVCACRPPVGRPADPPPGPRAAGRPAHAPTYLPSIPEHVQHTHIFSYTYVPPYIPIYP